MAHIVADRVRETSTTTGTGSYDLDGAVLGFQDFDAACATNDTIYYVASMGADWEVGTGTFTAGSPDTLARTTILASSNGGAAVNWGAGIKDIAGTWPASALSTVDLDVPHCGRLARSSATLLTFPPFNGDRIKINGVIYAIPSAGIAGLGNTGVYVGGIAGQNLGANTTYYVFAHVVAGVVTGNFHTGVTHETSDTAGNVGVETMSGSNDAYTFLGIIRTNASSQFEDTAQNRHVISWFNRRLVVAQGAFTADRSTTSTSFVEINSEIAIDFLSFAEPVILGVAGAFYNASGVGSGRQLIYVDGAAIDGVVYSTSGAAAYGAPVAGLGLLGGSTAVSEGAHTATLYGKTSAGTQTWLGAATAERCSLIAVLMG